MAAVTFDNASRVYPGAEHPAVDALNLEIDDGEFLVLVGPSGCGKSTSLRMLAGLEEVTTGTIRIGGRDVTHVPPKDSDIAMVFQNYALYPHMSVRQNMGFALKMSGISKNEINERVDKAAQILDLTPFLDRKPRAMSGGQRQRVAMGRAIVREPQVFLMDEPLSNLDAKLRVQTRAEISALQRRIGVTTVYVTHDQTEAMTMGDRVAVMKDGVLQQVGTPGELFDNPVNRFVAGFIGSPSMNQIVAPSQDGALHIGGVAVALPDAESAAIGAAAGRSFVLGFRPEDVALTSEGFPAQVTLVEILGADAYVHATVSVEGKEVPIVFRTDGRVPPRMGDTVRLTIAGQHVHLFDADTGERVLR